MSQYRKTLAECQLDEFWRGELDLELQSLDALWQYLQQVDEQLEKVAKQDEQVHFEGGNPELRDVFLTRFCVSFSVSARKRCCSSHNALMRAFFSSSLKLSNRGRSFMAKACHPL